MSHDLKPVALNDLYMFIARATRLVVRDSPLANSVELLNTTARADLDDLRRCMVLEVPAKFMHCMCYGSPALYLYASNGRPVELTNHHGILVRCSLWDSDVPITDIERWLSWFDQRGIPGPRSEVEKGEALKRQRRQDRERWINAMPKAITPLLLQELHEDFPDIATLRAAIEREVPFAMTRIRLLFHWFGSGAGRWSVYPSYEEIAEVLLLEYPTATLLRALQSAPITETQTEGAARLFAGWRFGKARPHGLREVPDSVKAELWQHSMRARDPDTLARAQVFAPRASGEGD